MQYDWSLQYYKCAIMTNYRALCKHALCLYWLSIMCHASMPCAYPDLFIVHHVDMHIHLVSCKYRVPIHRASCKVDLEVNNS
jgi:hypothetical protein